MTVAEGGDKNAVLRKFRDVYVPSLKANYIVWPAVQIINFRLMPIQYQIVSFQPSEVPKLLADDPLSSPLSQRLELLGPHTFL